MNRSLSLNPLTRRGTGEAVKERPDGPVLWVHATSPLRLAFLRQLADRLVALREDLHVVASFDPDLVQPTEQDTAAFTHLAPLTAQAGRGFLNTWRPDVGLWTGGFLIPGLIRQAEETGTRLLLADAVSDGFQGRKRRWFSDPVQDSIGKFRHALASSPEAADTLRRAGLVADRIEVTSEPRLIPSPPACDDEDVAEVAAELTGRPVWLAAQAHPDEFGYIVTAHRNALRMAHRLLLVVVVQDATQAADLGALLDGMTLRHTQWQLGDPIGDETQVLVAQEPEDLGLWYRIAPQCFLGHSLIPGQGGTCPLHAAALGSAILHGPNVGAYMDSYTRLSRAEATRLVPDGNALGVEVSRLTAPDLAAAMALAGWDVATEGAELTERLVTLIYDQLDQAKAGQVEAGHART